MKIISILSFIILMTSCSTQEMVTDSVYDTNLSSDQIDYYNYNDITYNYPRWYNYSRFGFGVNIMNGPYYHPYWGWVRGYGNWSSYGYYNPWNSGIYNSCGYYGYGNSLYGQGCLCYGYYGYNNYNSLYGHRPGFGAFRFNTQPPNIVRSPRIVETRDRYQRPNRIQNVPIERRVITQPRVTNPQDRGGSRPTPTPLPIPNRPPTRQSR